MTKFTAIELTDGQIIDVSEYKAEPEYKFTSFYKSTSDDPYICISKSKISREYDSISISFPPYTVFLKFKTDWVALGVALYLHAPRQSQTFGGIMIKEV